MNSTLTRSTSHLTPTSSIRRHSRLQARPKQQSSSQS